MGDYDVDREIISAKEKSLIIICDTRPQKLSVVYEKLKKEPTLRFLIFDHHYDKPRITDKRITFIWKPIQKCSMAYYLVKKWLKETDFTRGDVCER